MKSLKIDLYSNRIIGRIKKLNGGNLAPPISSEKAGRNIRATFRDLNMPLTRLHDAPLENAGTRIVDIPMIFANFHADETDPRNYYFHQTDDYIKNCLECGTNIYFRLGVSIEHGQNKYFISPPSDIDKWINICDHIIRHYTEAWADGFKFDIKYWEIWNEPECCDTDGLHLMWGGSVQAFNDFYVKVAKELKKRFPHLKFGGPAHCDYSKLSSEFIEFCAVNRAPLDFYSYHYYSESPYGWIQESPALVREELNAHGFTNTEIHLNEWHYFPGDWKKLRSDSEYKDRLYDEMKGLDSAAFICTCMALWQNTPLDMGCYYTATTTAWGLYKTGSDTPTKSYYGMKAFGTIVRYPERLLCSSSCQDVTVLAGQDDKGKKCLLISCFKTSSNELDIHCDFELNPATCKVKVLDSENNLNELEPVFCADRLKVHFTGNSAVILISFD